MAKKTISCDNIKFQTISMLPELSGNVNISENSLFEIAYCIKNEENSSKMYSSKSVTIEKLTSHIISKTKENFEQSYKLTSDIDFEKINKTVNDYLFGNSETSLLGEHIFEDPIQINNSVTSNFLENSSKVATIESLSAFSKTYNPLFLSKDGSFVTNYYNIETQESLEQDGLEFAPSTEMQKHNAFIFRMVGTESTDTWKCPKSGWFMCYGWVDEESRDNNQSVNRWVALEGKFINGGKEFWKILQFFPIVANTSQAQYCSYVTFSLPVQEGLELRLRSGFKVGTNSGLYWNIRGSMTSHIANAFVGGIYSGFSS